MPRLTTAAISLELLQDCLGTLEQLTTGITNLGVEATSNPLQAPRVRVLLEDLLTSLLIWENDLGTYEGGLFDLRCVVLPSAAQCCLRTASPRSSPMTV